jgi:uncharacterized protein DUF6898
MPAREKKSGEIYFEHLQLGIYHKVVAVDADSGVEVTVMGPARTNPKQLEDVALRKLQMRMAKDH